MQKGRVRLSIGQLLLILVDRSRNDPDKLKELKQLYLNGIETDHQREKLQQYLQDIDMSEFLVSINEFSNNDDITRRYFETHLAHQTLKECLPNISYNNLQEHYNFLYNSLPQPVRHQYDRILNGQLMEQDAHIYQEYADFIMRAQSSKDYQDFSSDDRDKILLFGKIAFLGVVTAWHNPSLPLDIYGSGFFAEDKKGKALKQAQSQVRSQHRGLMRSYDPVPKDDIAMSDTVFPYLRPADQAYMIREAEWVKANSSTLVHPFSNGISGTMLCQLRNILQAVSLNKTPFQSSSALKSFMRGFISSLLINSGGHSLNEFTYPLSLPEVIKSFSPFIPEFASLNLSSIFPMQNETAINAAIDYNKSVIGRQKTRDALQSFTPIRGSISTLPVQENLHGNITRYTNTALNRNLMATFPCFTNTSQARSLLALNNSLDTLEKIAATLRAKPFRHRQETALNLQWMAAKRHANEAFLACEKELGHDRTQVMPLEFKKLYHSHFSHWKKWHNLPMDEQLQCAPCPSRLVGVPIVQSHNDAPNHGPLETASKVIRYIKSSADTSNKDVCLIVNKNKEPLSLLEQGNTKSALADFTKSHLSYLANAKPDNPNPFNRHRASKLLSEYHDNRLSEATYHGLVFFGMGFGSSKQIKLDTAKRLIQLMDNGFPGSLRLNKKHLLAMLEKGSRLSKLMHELLGTAIMQDIAYIARSKKSSCDDLEIFFSFTPTGNLKVTAEIKLAQAKKDSTTPFLDTNSTPSQHLSHFLRM